MDLMNNWVDIEVEKVSVCVICGVRTVKVWVTLGGLPVFFRAPCIIFRASEKEFRGRI